MLISFPNLPRESLPYPEAAFSMCVRNQLYIFGHSRKTQNAQGVSCQSVSEHRKAALRSSWGSLHHSFSCCLLTSSWIVFSHFQFGNLSQPKYQVITLKTYQCWTVYSVIADVKCWETLSERISRNPSSSSNELSVQFSHSVVSDSLWPHEQQHTRPPCPSPTPGVYPNSCPLSQRCYPTISSSVIPFSSWPQSFPASGSFQVSQLFTSGGPSIGVSALTSVLPVNTQDWSPLGLTGCISLQSKGLSRVFSNTTVQKHQFFCTQLSLMNCRLT